MFKRISLTTLAIVGATALLAWVIFYFSSETGLKGYASIQIYCSIGLVLIGCCLVGGSVGPRWRDDAHAQLMIAHPDIDQLDKQDRKRSAPLGLVIFAAGLLSGGLGYTLYQFS